MAASEGELGSGDDNSAALPPSGRVALPESEPEQTDMLSRAAESVGLHWSTPPFPECSRLDNWFLGAQADRRQPPPVLPETGLVPPLSSPPSTAEWPKGMWRCYLPVALLSSVACELAPLRIVLLCVFLYLFFYFFYFSFDTCMSDSYFSFSYHMYALVLCYFI